ncbi:MAG: tetratricopeptide repeat protein [Melioribacteraceae bacterium]|nr:tetratricopeptide repeat protein [Melioribacteraceae bacterium]MCF8431763.1 tetratricopeptide repeat protein [Melioribacteraceae bacterium]
MALIGCSFAGETSNYGIVKKEAFQLVSLADRYYLEGDTESALAVYKEAFNKFSMIDDLEGKVLSSLYISGTYNVMEQFDEANEWFDKASNYSEGSYESILTLTKCEQLYQRKNYEEILNLISSKTIESYQNEIQLQLDSYELLSAQALNKTIESLRDELISNYNSNEINTVPEIKSFLGFSIGKSYFYSGEFSKANQYLSEALSIDKELANTPAIAETLFMLGLNSEAMGDITEARTYFQRSYESYSSINSFRKMSEIEKKIDSL